ncbi:MAG: hypothetical protein HWD59_00920 [Coxiellaceae bacterium]|nr:MAG: hypothetical protein HWD59_00920 [Coxiellaceae bacterium]
MFDKYDVTDKNLDDFTVFSALNQLVTEIPSYSDDLVKEKNNNNNGNNAASNQLLLQVSREFHPLLG